MRLGRAHALQRKSRQLICTLLAFFSVLGAANFYGTTSGNIFESVAYWTMLFDFANLLGRLIGTYFLQPFDDLSF
jgi:hypothetical protein